MDDYLSIISLAESVEFTTEFHVAPSTTLNEVLLKCCGKTYDILHPSNVVC